MNTSIMVAAARMCFFSLEGKVKKILKPRYYKHIDKIIKPADLKIVERKIKNKNYIIHHGFYPFLSYTSKFKKFIKIKGHPHGVQKFREELLEQTDKYMTLGVKKDKTKSILYLFSGKDFDEFIDWTKKIHFREFRTNIEKYMSKKPKVMGLSEAKKLLKKD